MKKIAKIVGAALCFAFIAGNAYADVCGCVPEIDPGQIPALIALAGGGLFILRSKIRK